MEVRSKQQLEEMNNDIDVHTSAGTPIRYLSLDHVYSATSPCPSGSSNVMSKKVKARKLLEVDGFDTSDQKPLAPIDERPPVVHVYSRRSKKTRRSGKGVTFADPLVVELKPEVKVEEVVDDGVKLDASSVGRRKQLRKSEGDCRNDKSSSLKKKRKSSPRWVRLSFEGADPNAFVGLECKVYWPLDAEWYTGRVSRYCSATNKYHVQYKDGDEEELILSNERVNFFISHEAMDNLKLSRCLNSVEGDDEMLVLAASLDDSQELEPGDIIWAKLTGHAMWPAIVVDESLTVDRKGLGKLAGGKSVPVQFFGTHDFARIPVRQVISFLKGLLSSFHLKCKKPRFLLGLEEAKMVLKEQKLPRKMLHLQNGMNIDEYDASGEDEGNADSGEDCATDVGIWKGLKTSPYVIGDLQVISLGKIVKDSEYFHDDKWICPEGYTALRKFTSIKDPSVQAIYKMEVLRDAESQIRPLFRVTLDSGEQFKGATPSTCWNKIYRRMTKMQNGPNPEERSENIHRSGSDMFGFSNPEVAKLVQELSNSTVSSKSSMRKSASGRYGDLPVGYRPVRVDWKDLDKCNVCHMDEEYENNLFKQCDKCRMMVHAKCYGEVEPHDGVLWLCNLCRPGAPEFSPPCCLCPVTGGAMKPTTDGRWAHLACAIWIPETCLSDIKRMQPIDGINRVNKDRWKLLCSICGVSYGACIQCSNNSCRVAYHPLCARAAGLCVELENEDRLHLLSFEDEEANQCIRLLSFCKKHRQPSNAELAADERIGRTARQCSDYKPPSNPSGCARTEPYNYFGRRGRKEPEALAAASLKRLFVQNQPYLVGGHTQHLFGSGTSSLPSDGVAGSKFCSSGSKMGAPNDIFSIAEKYKFMRETFRKRLAFGKSGIHGFGIFTKLPHRAGDMVIEYIGELVRPPVADRRERFIYNSLVGAGTYMFRIDDERVIDATRAGSIAHLINHSCEPNCYSRAISVNGDEHIIIFAKRDIKSWEELTYDYRFFSIDEKLPCYCGFPRCRGIVNEAEDRSGKLKVPCSELTDWRGE